jgi:signal transduction histidine kinase
MDIEVIIKRTLVFAALFAIVFGMFVGITLLTQELLAGGRLLGLAISSLVIIFTVRPLEILLVRITDKYLFQKKYDYKHLIREFMDELRTMVLNTNDIAQSSVDFLNASIRPVSSAIFMYNRFTSRYDLIASSDFKDTTINIAGDSPLVKLLGNAGTILNMKSEEKTITLPERKRLAESGVELVIPLLIHKELIGFVCLGKKKSDEDYSSDDIEALSDLSGALSISLNNAQLFDERADAEKRALVGTIATGINHEVGNPLNIITIKLDTFRIMAKEVLLAKKTKEDIIEDVTDIAKTCLVSAQRIAEITKQVSEFAKPDKKLVFDKVNINEAIDETIAFLKNGMILDTEKIEKKIARDGFYVMADRGQLKQILFNLIKNASHAIDKERGKITIQADRINDGEVAIRIIDNGHGMSKEVRERIFTPFFTTKEPGKGTGLGLALVKIMIDRNNGKIKVDSEEGDGTTFTLIFKGGVV